MSSHALCSVCGHPYSSSACLFHMKCVKTDRQITHLLDSLPKSGPGLDQVEVKTRNVIQVFHMSGRDSAIYRVWTSRNLEGRVKPHTHPLSDISIPNNSLTVEQNTSPSFSYKDTSQLQLGSTLMTSFNYNYLLKAPSQVQLHWSLEPQQEFEVGQRGGTQLIQQHLG